MPQVLEERRLIVVTGKGGTGKTTVAAALALQAAERGLRTLVVEVGSRRRLEQLFGLLGARERTAPQEGEAPGGEGHAERELEPGLWCTSIDPDEALREWLMRLGGRLAAKVLGSSATFQYFTAAAPGAKELLTMVKVWELTREPRWDGRARAYDLVLLDAPATGHALAMLAAPRTYGAIARVGSIASQASAVEELLRGPECGYLAVARASEMAITETIELQEGLREKLGREFDAAIVNAVMPRRFSHAELARIEQGLADLAASDPLAAAALRTARSAHDRAGAEQAQVARLRRRHHPDGARMRVVSVPFVFQPELDLAALRRVGGLLVRRLDGPPKRP